MKKTILLLLFIAALAEVDPARGRRPPPRPRDPMIRQIQHHMEQESERDARLQMMVYGYHNHRPPRGDMVRGNSRRIRQWMKRPPHVPDRPLHGEHTSSGLVGYGDCCFYGWIPTSAGWRYMRLVPANDMATNQAPMMMPAAFPGGKRMKRQPERGANMVSHSASHQPRYTGWGEEDHHDEHNHDLDNHFMYNGRHMGVHGWIHGGRHKTPSDGLLHHHDHIPPINALGHPLSHLPCASSSNAVPSKTSPVSGEGDIASPVSHSHNKPWLPSHAKSHGNRMMYDAPNNFMPYPVELTATDEYRKGRASRDHKNSQRWLPASVIRALQHPVVMG